MKIIEATQVAKTKANKHRQSKKQEKQTQKGKGKQPAKKKKQKQRALTKTNTYQHVKQNSRKTSLLLAFDLCCYFAYCIAFVVVAACIAFGFSSCVLFLALGVIAFAAVVVLFCILVGCAYLFSLLCFARN